MAPPRPAPADELDLVEAEEAESAAPDLLAGLDESQRRAVTNPSNPLAILAPAGSGKTRVLTRRIAHRVRTGDAEARHVLALTFTRKAAGELGERLHRLGVGDRVTAGTFHAIALAQLRRRQAERGRELPALLTRKGRVLAPLLGAGRGARAVVALSEVASEIEWAKARLVSPSAFASAAEQSGRRLPRPAEELAELYRRYEEEKRNRGFVDFDDLLWWCAQALEHDPDFAAAQRWRFRHLFVDEFQDVNPAQLRLLRGWLGDRRDLCVVGDDAQAIYGFAGADAGPLRFFPRRFPGASVERLEVNYRSTPQVVRASAAVLGRAAGVERPLPHAPGSDGPIPVATAYADDAAEARGVAAAIARARAAGVRPADVAILFRTNAQSAAFEAALAREGIPARVLGGTRFVDRPEVRAVLDELADVDRASPGRAFTDHLADLEVAAAETAAGGEERREHAGALARLGHDYLAAEDGSGSLAGFRAWLDAALRDEPASAGTGVDLLTFHRAKGLEWPVVHVTGLESGLVPISHARSAATVAEERRLLHVALSRAERELHLSWARTRARGGRTAERKPSPWLDLVLQASDPGAADRVADSRSALRAARGALAAASTAEGGPRADPDLLEALKAWRLGQARATGVPAYVVFHDRTLEAVAAHRPTDDAALLAIPGVGPTKVERYGPAVLELVAAAPGAEPPATPAG